MANPNRFLAAVQIGVTLAGFLSAAFGAATLSDNLAPVLVGWGVPVGVAGATALVLVTVAIASRSQKLFKAQWAHTGTLNGQGIGYGQLFSFITFASVGIMGATAAVVGIWSSTGIRRIAAPFSASYSAEPMET